MLSKLVGEFLVHNVSQWPNLKCLMSPFTKRIGMCGKFVN